MKRKSVRLDEEAYRRLVLVKRPDETFSAVIKRLFPKLPHGSR